MMYKMKSIIAVAMVLGAVAYVSAKPSDKPNVVVILTDDMGYWDTGFSGGPVIETPNLDKLAESGMLLTDFYACSPWCSPSRAGLLTGRHPYRTGIYGPITLHSGPNHQHLRAEEVTLAQVLKGAGYDTCHVGKWHLIGQKGDPTPNEFGFDHAFWTEQDARHNILNPAGFIRNKTPLPRLEGLSAKLCAEEAIGWLKDRPDQNKPFFINFWAHEAHSPHGTTDEYINQYRKHYRENECVFYGMVTHMDAAIGMLVDELEALGQLDNTLILFSADNGCEIIVGDTEIDPRTDTNHGNTGPLRYWKGFNYEGGIRVPAFAFWPRGIQPGQVCSEPMSSLDYMPTLCAIAKQPLPDRNIDGENILPVLQGKPFEREQPLFFWSAGRDRHHIALRDGDYKLMATEGFEDLELYDLSTDIREKRNLVAQLPEVAQRMVAEAKRIKAKVAVERDQHPSKNWNTSFLLTPEERKAFKTEVWNVNMHTTLPDPE